MQRSLGNFRGDSGGLGLVYTLLSLGALAVVHASSTRRCDLCDSLDGQSNRNVLNVCVRYKKKYNPKTKVKNQVGSNRPVASTRTTEDEPFPKDLEANQVHLGERCPWDLRKWRDARSHQPRVLRRVPFDSAFV